MDLEGPSDIVDFSFGFRYISSLLPMWVYVMAELSKLDRLISILFMRKPR